MKTAAEKLSIDAPNVSALAKDTVSASGPNPFAMTRGQRFVGGR
jgi:hypothetical protein